jgi:RNA-directed DNA polymerase
MLGFNPAVSKDALKGMGAQVRSWRLHRCTTLTESDLARWINPIVRGWMQYYGAFYRSALYPLLQRINAYLVRWLRAVGASDGHSEARGVRARFSRIFSHTRSRKTPLAGAEYDIVGSG